MNASEIDGMRRCIIWLLAPGYAWENVEHMLVENSYRLDMTNVYFIFMLYLYYSSTSKRVAYLAQGLPCSC